MNCAIEVARLVTLYKSVQPYSAFYNDLGVGAVSQDVGVRTLLISCDRIGLMFIDTFPAILYAFDSIEKRSI